MDTSETSSKETKRAKRGPSKKIWTLPFLAFCGVAFLLLAYLCQSAQLVRIQYEVLAKRQEIKQLQGIRADLELSVQELTSLERVEHYAVNQLKRVDGEWSGTSTDGLGFVAACRHIGRHFNTATKTHRYAQTVGQAHTYAYPPS